MTTDASNLPKRTPAWFWVVFALLAMVHALRSLGHTSPIYGGDEYAYLISGLHRDHLEWLWSRDPMLQKVTNPVYLWVISAMNRLFVDVSAVMRLFNVFVYCLTVAWCARWVALRSGWASAFSVLALVGLLPSSTFTAAVMADVPYYCAVVLTALLTCGAIARSPRWASAMGGSAAALAFLIKPHALSIIGATSAFVLLAPFFLISQEGSGRTARDRLRQGLACVGCFLLALYMSLLVGSVLFYGKVIWNPQYPLGIFYADIAGHMSSSGAQAALERPMDLARYVMANLASALTVMWPFLMVLALASRRAWLHARQQRSGSCDSMAVLGWLLLAIPMATGMSAFFTFSISIGQDGEAWRVHARYYAFLYIIAITGALAVKDWTGLLRTPVLQLGRLQIDGYLLIAITWPLMWALCAWAFKDMRIWFQDNVELFHLLSANWRMPHPVTQRLMVGAIILATLLFAFKARRIKLLSAMALTTASSMALWEVTCIQHIHSSVIHFRIETGQLVKSIIPKASDEEILVVGTARYGQTAHVLYGMQRPVHVRQVAPGTAVDRALVPGGVRYIFSVDDAPIALPTRVLLSTPAGSLHQILDASGH